MAKEEETYLIAIKRGMEVSQEFKKRDQSLSENCPSRKKA
jgi:hypothetical protein